MDRHEYEKAVYDLNAKMQGAARDQAASGLSGCETACPSEARELLIHRLLRQKRMLERDHEKYDRAISILERHPEFEELMELLRSGIV